MGCGYEVEVVVTVKSVEEKNGYHDWPYYPSISVDDDDDGDVFPRKFVTHFNGPINDAALHIKVSDAKANEKVIGSARLSLSKVVGAVGLGKIWSGKLELKGPSGRVQGTVEVEIVVTEPAPEKVKKRKQEMEQTRIQTVDYGESKIQLTANKNAKIFNFGGNISIITKIPTHN